MDADELFQSLKAFSLKSKSATIDLRQFAASMRPKAGEIEVETALRQLEEQGRCGIAPDKGPAQSVTITDYFLMLLEDEYRSLTVEAAKPFPQEASLPIPIPPSRIVSVDMKSDFATFLSGPSAPEHTVARLVFPEGIEPLVVPRSMASTVLVEAAVAKISAYLSDPRNAGFIESKLISIFKGNDVLIRQMMEDAAVRPKKASESVFSTSDFAFRFWTYLVNLVLQDFRKKKEKTHLDHGVCQSAYIVGYYSFFRKGQAQKEMEINADRKSLETLVRKAPYVFTFEDLYALTDEKGVPLVSKHSHQFIHSFLDEKSRRQGDESLPFMVRIHVNARNKDYFIQKDLLVPVFLKKLSEAAEELHDQYVSDWVAGMRRHAHVPAMKNDASFQKDVELKVKDGYPFLTSLANAPLLYLARSEANLSPESQEEIHRCFESSGTLRPLNELMGLFRNMILAEARSYLPIWETMPILRQIVALIHRLFASRGRAEKTAAPLFQKQTPAAPRPVEEEAPAPPVRRFQARTQAAQAVNERDAQARYRRALILLRDRFVPIGKNVDAALEELAEKWNPLFADGPKRELVDDVNALVRDFLRPVKRSLLSGTPDPQRIHALAEQLCGSKSLVKIKKKEPLLRYLELYIIKCLEPPRKQI